MPIATADVGSANILLDFREQKPVENEIGQIIAWNANRTEVIGALPVDYTHARYFNQSTDDYTAVDTALKRSNNPAKLFYTDESATTLYAETVAAYDVELAANPGTAIRRPEDWMIRFNPFIPQAQLSAPIVAGQSASITLWGYFANLSAAQTAAGLINAVWGGSTFNTPPGNGWVHGYNALPAAQPANTQLFAAHTTAFEGTSGWSYATPQANLAGSAFDIQYTSVENPNSSTVGHYPFAAGDVNYRIRLPNGLYGPWTPIASVPSAQWNVVMSRAYDWTDQNVQINFTSVLNLNDAHELLFTWQWREHDFQTAVVANANNSTTWIAVSDNTGFELGDTVLVGNEQRVITGKATSPQALIFGWALPAVPATGTIVRTLGSGVKVGYAEARILAAEVRCVFYSQRASYNRGRSLFMEFINNGASFVTVPASQPSGRGPGSESSVQSFPVVNFAMANTAENRDWMASHLYILPVYARNRPAEFRLLSR